MTSEHFYHLPFFHFYFTLSDIPIFKNRMCALSVLVDSSFSYNLFTLGELSLFALPRQPILRRDYRRRAVRYPFLLYTLHHGSDPLHHRGELALGDTRGVGSHVLVGVPTQHGFLEPLLTRRVRIATTHACAYAHTRANRRK